MRASQDTMEALHEALARQLLDAVKNGELVLTKDGEVARIGARAAVLNVARQFLKDNNIEAVPVPESPLKKLEETLGDLDDDDPDNVIQFGYR